VLLNLWFYRAKAVGGGIFFSVVSCLGIGRGVAPIYACLPAGGRFAPKV